MTHGKVSIKVDAAKAGSRMGIMPGGKAHRYYMGRVEAYMLPYLPYRNHGSVDDALIQGKEFENARFVMKGSHMKYLYYGKAMAGNPRVPTKRPLVYTKSPNAKAGPFWDKQVQQHHAKTIAAEVTKYLGGGK